MTIDAWPPALVPQMIGRPDLRGSVTSGTRTTSGVEQRVYSGAGRWEFRYRIPVHTRAKVLAASAMMDRLRSGESIVLKIYDMQRAMGLDGDVPAATIAGAVSAGATSLTLASPTAEVEPGLHFSIGQRLYRINRVTDGAASETIPGVILSDDAAWDDELDWDDGGNVTVSFLPPLRAAASSGAAVTFEDLVCLADLKDVTEGDMDLDLGKFGTLSLTFVEAR
ncbi:hypothetical protein [Ancylobacter radicis]|uniref:Uncharacterized protein n=1 Tax=Ancylobacter radicis TaxID=2836179 RepID=A0ABS5R788_9HYPH|nr:hypothetical protein [Ancylobacter radicis]MBS9476247.1 hypothetical protein [Ancylobacter radicis]